MNGNTLLLSDFFFTFFTLAQLWWNSMDYSGVVLTRPVLIALWPLVTSTGGFKEAREGGRFTYLSDIRIKDSQEALLQNLFHSQGQAWRKLLPMQT